MFNQYAHSADQELLTLMKQGDGEAFTTLYQRYWKRMYYKAAQKLGDHAVAEELVQDIFLDIWKRRESLEITGELENYLATALKFKVINHQAKEHHKLNSIREGKIRVTDTDNSTQDQIRFRELESRLAELVDKLPEKCRMVYALRQQGYSQREISQHLHISENTVESHVGHALRVIRAGLRHLLSSLL